MMKTNLVIGLFFVSGLAIAQDENTTKSDFNLKEAQSYAIENNYKNKKAMLDIDIAKKKVWETTAAGLPQVSANAKLQKFIDIPVSLAPANSFNPSAPAGELTELQFGLDYNNSVGISATQLILDGLTLLVYRRLKLTRVYQSLVS